MAKDLDSVILFDIYGALLTDKQRDTLDLYYNEDLSLREIADIDGITRQAAMNAVRAAEKRLAEFETALGLHSKAKQADELLNMLETHTDGSDEAEELIDKIRDLI